MMKILVIGGSGFIGSKFINNFSNSYQIVTCIRDASKVRETDDKDSVTEICAIENREIIDIIGKHKPDVVLNFTVFGNLKKCEENPQGAFNTNVYGIFNVIEGCKKTNSKLILLSSREVYGETVGQASFEDDPLLPRNILGITKMLAENLVINAHKSFGLNYTILRITNVYGPGGVQSGIYNMIRNAMLNKKIQIYGGGQRLNLIHVNDIVDAIDVVIKNTRSSNETFNLGSKENLSIEDVATHITTLLEDKIQIEHVTSRQGETKSFIPNISKLEKLLNFSPKIQMREGLEDTIKWIRSI